jgi:hypothetical protein
MHVWYPHGSVPKGKGSLTPKDLYTWGVVQQCPRNAWLAQT